MPQKPVQRNTCESRIARKLAKTGMVLVVARRYGLKIVSAPYAIMTPGGEICDGWHDLEPLARRLGCLAEHETILKWSKTKLNLLKGEAGERSAETLALNPSEAICKGTPFATGLG